MTKKRCAIYTRKSTDEGLDQAFNSLDAQREACAAYIVSQRHEGWILVHKAYDDGGFSGGSMERPALRILLDDIKSGLIDVIVVYKIDRLTRALADFAKMVEVFDAKGVSFVSVTQQFNTTTSMGRLIPASEVSRQLPLAFLAPSIVSAILSGQQSPEITAKSLLRMQHLPLAWNQQRDLLGFSNTPNN